MLLCQLQGQTLNLCFLQHTKPLHQQPNLVSKTDLCHEGFLFCSTRLAAFDVILFFPSELL